MKTCGLSHLINGSGLTPRRLFPSDTLFLHVWPITHHRRKSKHLINVFFFSVFLINK